MIEAFVAGLVLLYAFVVFKANAAPEIEVKKPVPKPAPKPPAIKPMWSDEKEGAWEERSYMTNPHAFWLRPDRHDHYVPCWAIEEEYRPKLNIEYTREMAESLPPAVGHGHIGMARRGSELRLVLHTAPNTRQTQLIAHCEFGRTPEGRVEIISLRYTTLAGVPFQERGVIQPFHAR